MPALARGRPIVVIDAGHGGRDPGAHSVSGEAAEKDLTLALARELRDPLVERGRVRVAMTRDDDRYLTLDDRAAVAHRLNAAMFVSLHMDSAPNPLARGASVYSLSDVASDVEAARFAAGRESRRRAGDGRDGSLETLLSDLTMRAQMSASADLAARLVESRRAGSSFARSRIALRRSTCFAAPKPRPCCSRADTSATPTMSGCCARPSTARPWRWRLPRRSKSTSPLVLGRLSSTSRWLSKRLDAARNEVRASERPRLAAPRSRRLQPEGARADRPVVGEQVGPPEHLDLRRLFSFFASIWLYFASGCLFADAARLPTAAADQRSRL